MHARVPLAVLLVASMCSMALPATGAQSSGAELAYTDPKGDATLGGSWFSVIPATAPTPATDAMDLVSFRLYGEDQEGFSIDIGVNNIKPVQNQLDFGTYVSFETTFKLDGSNVNYRLRINIPGSLARNPTGVVPIPVSFCLEEARGACLGQRVFATLDWDKSLMTVYIPKTAMMGHDPVGDPDRRPAQPPRLDVGSRIVEIRTTSMGGDFRAFISDVMPNAGGQGPYVMTSKAANDRLRLRLNSEQTQGRSGWDFYGWGTAIHELPTASVSPGSTSLIQISVENWNAGKRMINLSADIVEPTDSRAWDVRIVKTITVPGEDRRVVNLIVNITGAVEHRSTALVRVGARSLGFADEIGVLKVRLIAAVTPSPTQKTLFLHAEARPASTTSLCYPCDAKTWLNTLDEDPKGTADNGFPFPNARQNTLSGAEYSVLFPLDAPLNHDVVLSTRDPISAAINIRTSTPSQGGNVKLEIHGGDVFIGSGEGAWTGSGAAKITFQPNLEAGRIPTGSQLAARITLHLGPTNAANLMQLRELKPEIIPKGSQIDLPIIEDPRPPVKTMIPAGPAFLTLEVDGDAEQFVNPGKVRVFRLTLVNEGVQEDVVKFDVLKDPDNWYVALNPSDTYRLKPGESASIGLLVKPPSGAKEGEQAHILLNATSKADPAALAQASLTAIVTTGVELEDEEQNFTADEDTVAHIDEAPKKKSPGLGLVAIVATLGLVGLLRRRRA